jgi:hypothetical protein
MGFWYFISDEFRNQTNFSYFSTFPPLSKVKSDLNTNAPEYHSPRKQEPALTISLDFIDSDDTPNPSPSPSPSPVKSPVKSPRSPKSIKVYRNSKYNKK